MWSDMAVFDITFYSDSLHRQTPMTAILPVEELQIPGFPVHDRTGPFRSVYLLHGFSGMHTDWLRGAGIEELSILHNIAVFCPTGENSFYLDDASRDANYEKYLSQDVIGFTRRVFPLSKKREDTVIGGLSMGGYGALRNGLFYPEIYGSIIALSSALITDDLQRIVREKDETMSSVAYYRHVFGDPEQVRGSAVDPKALAQKLAQEKREIPRIFMACGTEDFLLGENRDFAACLTDLGIAHTYLEGPGEHNWAFWDRYIRKAFEWLGEGPRVR